MGRRRWLLMAALAAMVLPAPSQAQVSLQIGIGGGYVMPGGDYKGTAAEYYAGTNYGLDNGFGVHAKVRLGLVGINLTGEVAYAFLSNDGSPEGGNSSLEVSHRILSIKIGPEYRFGIPAVPVTPYLGANVSMNMFSGSTKFQGVSSVPSSTVDLAGASRIGAGATVGVVIASFDVAIHYNIHNLSGKAWTGGNARVDTYSSLNDDKDPAYAAGNTTHVVGEARSIQTVALTVSYILGI